MHTAAMRATRMSQFDTWKCHAERVGGLEAAKERQGAVL